MAIIIKSRKELIEYRKTIHGTVGLVPTMGNLHQGHLNLLTMSLDQNDNTILTIFVNPKQFGPNEDFAKYPRSLEEDINQINKINPKTIVFAPSSNEEIYPKNYDTKICASPLLANQLCGKSRPEHFDGVCTVVYQLFKMTSPYNAYFGKKDFQQLRIIQRMALDLGFPIDIHEVEIQRDYTGLALSSRNQYLRESELESALTLRKTLLNIESLINNNSIPDSLREFMKNDTNLTWEYLEIRNAKTLQPTTNSKENIVILGALKVGSTRLIDNIEVGS